MDLNLRLLKNLMDQKDHLVAAKISQEDQADPQVVCMDFLMIQEDLGVDLRVDLGVDLWDLQKDQADKNDS